MWLVYILEDEATGLHHYTGVTEEIDSRVAKHNAGDVPHTRKHRPWKLRSYTAFADKSMAYAFEKYLKSGSGRAFAKKRL